MQLLAVGKSFVAPRPVRNPFRVSRVGALRRFGAAVASPNGPALKTAALGEGLVNAVTEVSAGSAAGPNCHSVTWPQTNAEVRKLPISFVGRERPQPVKVSPHEDAKGSGRLQGGRGAASTSSRAPGPTAPTSSGARAITTEAVPREKRVLFNFRPAARPANGSARAAASLDEVKVIRNDLSEADVEVVPAPAKGSEPPPPSPREVEPIGWTLMDWHRLADRFKVFSRAGA
jgi:hypothetical protein